MGPRLTLAASLRKPEGPNQVSSPPPSRILAQPALIPPGRVPATTLPAEASGPGPPHRAPPTAAASASNKEKGPRSSGGHPARSEGLGSEKSLLRECYGGFLPRHNICDRKSHLR